MDRSRKEELVAEIQQTLEGATLLVVTHQNGLTVQETTALRHQMREAGAGFKVTKNRLAKIALKDTQFEPLSDLFSGPTAIAVSEDPVAAARVAVDFAKDNDKLTIVGGALGDKVLDVDAVMALAKLPSLDALRGKLVGLLQAPASKIVGVLQAPGGQLARVFGAYGAEG
ncbi:MAG: 50S ribosomal protein L10 [Alphaproteobacteria bacterium]|nr:50S ribosomal protein L10 [Alphaproteobacteria bacterium]